MNQAFCQDLSKQRSGLQRKDVGKKKSLHKRLLLGPYEVSFSKPLSCSPTRTPAL